MRIIYILLITGPLFASQLWAEETGKLISSAVAKENGETAKPAKEKASKEQAAKQKAAKAKAAKKAAKDKAVKEKAAKAKAAKEKPPKKPSKR